MLMVVALVLTGCTHLPWKPYQGWRSWKAADVTVHTDTISQYEPALEWLQTGFTVYQETFFKPWKIPPVQAVYISSDNPTPFLSNAGTSKDAITLARWPWAEAKGGRSLLVVGYSEWQWMYYHQLAHHFIEAAVPGAPLWFHEGFARYLTRIYQVPGKPQEVCFGRDPPGATTRVSLPLKELLAAGYREYNESSEPWIGPLSQAFIDYLLHGEGGRLRPAFTDLMRALAAGKTGEQALAATYAIPFDQLESRFHMHVRSARPPGLVCPLGFTVAALTAPRPEPIRTPVEESDVRALFESLEKLPDRNGYADFFPGSGPGQ
jgi:hypothetical protein